MKNEKRKMVIASRKRRIIYENTKRIVRIIFGVCHQRRIRTFAINKMIYVCETLIRRQKWFVLQRLAEHGSIEGARLIIQAFARMIITKQNCSQIRYRLRKRMIWESSIIICLAARQKLANNQVAQMKLRIHQLECLKKEKKSKQKAIYILQKYVRAFLNTLHLEKVVTERSRSISAIKIQSFYRAHSEIKKKRALVAKEFIALALQRIIRQSCFLEKETIMNYHATFIQLWWKEKNNHHGNLVENEKDKTPKKSSVANDDRKLKPLHDTLRNENIDKPCADENISEPYVEASSTLSGMSIVKEPSIVHVDPLKETHDSHER